MLPISTKDLITVGIILLGALPCLMFGLWLGQNGPAIGLSIGAVGLVGLMIFIFLRLRRTN